MSLLNSCPKQHAVDTFWATFGLLLIPTSTTKIFRTLDIKHLTFKAGRYYDRSILFTDGICFRNIDEPFTKVATVQICFVKNIHESSLISMLAT